MSASVLSRTRHGCKISAWSYNGPGVAMTPGNPTAVNGDGYDTCEYDTGGYTGAIVQPVDPDAYPDNYLAGSGILTVPGHLAGRYRITGTALPGGQVIAVGTMIGTRATIKVVRATGGGTWQSDSAYTQAGPAAADFGVPSGVNCRTSQDLYLNAGDTVQLVATIVENSAGGGSPSPTVYAILELELLGR